MGTYPLPTGSFESMIFLFPRWDILVPWCSYPTSSYLKKPIKTASQFLGKILHQPRRLRSSCWQPLLVATNTMARTERRPRLRMSNLLKKHRDDEAEATSPVARPKTLEMEQRCCKTMQTAHIIVCVLIWVKIKDQIVHICKLWYGCVIIYYACPSLSTTCVYIRLCFLTQWQQGR